MRERSLGTEALEVPQSCQGVLQPKSLGFWFPQEPMCLSIPAVPSHWLGADAGEDGLSAYATMGFRASSWGPWMIML